MHLNYLFWALNLLYSLDSSRNSSAEQLTDATL